MTGESESLSLDSAVEIRDLRVDYGDFVAVNDVSLSVPYGEVFGLVGPNGAGKTSTFRVLATLMEPTYGEVSLAGVDILENTESARRILGYMPDLAPVPSDLKVWEFLSFHADTHRLGNAAARRKRLEECLEVVNLADKREAWCKELSRGQTQRVVLAKTFLHEPKVLILDEPASGLDPLSRREMRLALQALAREGATVIVSSHILSELAEMCSSLCVMNRGHLLASGTAEEVRHTLGSSDRKLTVAVLKGIESLVDWLSKQHGVKDVEQLNGDVRFQFHGDEEEQADLLEGMLRLGTRIRKFEEQASSFEEILIGVSESNNESVEKS